MQTQWYEQWFNSPFYHKLYFERDEKEATDFIKKLVAHLGMQKGQRILDVACGRGRHSKLFASMGFDVTGIDISPGNIDIANQSGSDNLHFFVHDMRLPFWGNYFDHAFNFFTSFGYFRTRREHNAAIRTIARSLRTNATFVIDYLNVAATIQNLVPGETKVIDNTSYAIERWYDVHHFYKRISISDPSISQPLVFTEQVARFTLEDFRDMLSLQGLEIKNLFGNYQLDAFDENKSPRLIIEAQKIQAVTGDKEKRLYSDGRKTDALT